VPEHVLHHPLLTNPDYADDHDPDTSAADSSGLFALSLLE
jgi:hypothetical protein